MISAENLDSTIHNLCIYDKDPGNHLWPYLLWHHNITGYFTVDTFHVADEGHADYTYLDRDDHYHHCRTAHQSFSRFRW